MKDKTECVDVDDEFWTVPGTSTTGICIFQAKDKNKWVDVDDVPCSTSTQ